MNFIAIFDELDLPDMLKPYVPNYKYWLCDLSRYDDEDIKGEIILRLGTLLLKYILRDDLPEALRVILPLLIEVLNKETGLAYIETVLRYLTVGTDKLTKSELNQLLHEVFVEGEKLMPTIAEEWIDQGHKIGLKEGIEKDKRDATIKAITRSLSIRFNTALTAFDERLIELPLSTLEEISELVLTVQSLTEFEEILVKQFLDTDS